MNTNKNSFKALEAQAVSLGARLTIADADFSIWHFENFGEVPLLQLSFSEYSQGFMSLEEVAKELKALKREFDVIDSAALPY